MRRRLSPFETAPDPLVMGLRPIVRDETLLPYDTYAAQMPQRLRLLDTRRDEVFASRPGADDAAAEVLQWLGDRLPRLCPATFAPLSAGLHNRVTGETVPLGPDPAHPLLRAGRLVQDDLLLLTPAGRLEAAVLCFPSRWRLADKIGRPLLNIHAPVPGYAAVLAARVNRLFATLAPGRAVLRHNWSVLDDAALFQPEAGQARHFAGDPGRDLVLRTERQTLTRLHTHLLFTIRVRVASLASAVPDRAAAAAMATAVRGLPPGLAAYKGLSGIAGPLLQWLDARAAMPQAGSE
ncbi:heme-dependent oxidative N-demethylase family protein [Acidisphaera rubrifaciens]|uniref:DUF3445 domain-containing protein n=1 Tax=Acidisphaera rubrifaciens HS-AP3 TaxID=1231350 RepID=A0A0D6P6D4_9PROT|nr:DUF3445 domain-containing protein [Acidisphaera rubrifaciens]GAN76758.1 hypothetical protein Asru_0160_08 [Acidisphaera rubrifaciens HS-AP3]